MRIMLLRKKTLAKLFGPKVPARHLMGFAEVLNQGIRGKTFSQELHRERSTSGLQRAPAGLQERISPPTSPCLASRPGQPGRWSRERWVGWEHPASLAARDEIWLSPEARAVQQTAFSPGRGRG